MNYANFDDLNQEHEAFLRYLAQARKTLPTLVSLERFFFLLDKIHHEKEERFLFPLLFTGATEQSGPKCATFFPPRWMNSCAWQDSFHALQGLLGSEQAELNISRQMVFSSPSMLRIPLEDHILGERAVAKMRAEPSLIGEIFPKFSELLSDHIQRENECLFELARTALNPEQKQAYASAAAAFDTAAGSAALLESL